MSTFLENYKSSCKYGPHKNVKSWSFLVLCTIAVPICLSTFMFIEQKIHDNSSTPDSGTSLQIFDLRNGYSPTEVHSTLRAWGSQGRMLYLLIELVDCTIYHFAYRGVFLVLLNQMSDQIVMRWEGIASLTSGAANIPFFLAWVDLFEDIGQVNSLFGRSVMLSNRTTRAFSMQVTMVVTMPSTASAPLWSLLVKITSSINVFKWFGAPSPFVHSVLY